MILPCEVRFYPIGKVPSMMRAILVDFWTKIKTFLICKSAGVKMKSKAGFEIVMFSDQQYEKITAEIQFAGEQIAQINMDKGKDQLEIEL